MFHTILVNLICYLVGATLARHSVDVLYTSYKQLRPKLQTDPGEVAATVVIAGLLTAAFLVGAIWVMPTMWATLVGTVIALTCRIYQLIKGE